VPYASILRRAVASGFGGSSQVAIVHLSIRRPLPLASTASEPQPEPRSDGGMTTPALTRYMIIRPPCASSTNDVPNAEFRSFAQVTIACLVGGVSYRAFVVSSASIEERSATRFVLCILRSRVEPT